MVARTAKSTQNLVLIAITNIVEEELLSASWKFRVELLAVRVVEFVVGDSVGVRDCGT